MTKQILLSAPNHHLEQSMKDLIVTWDDPPTPLQILKVLDFCIQGALATGMMINILQDMHQKSCQQFNTSHEEVIKRAVWRSLYIYS